MIHETAHPLSRKTVTLEVKGVDPDRLSGRTYWIEDWWDRVSGGSWMDARGNPAALKYAMRNILSGMPLDNEVVYGKVDGLGHIVHVSELRASAEQTA